MDYTRLSKEELVELLNGLNESMLRGGPKSRLVLDLQAHQVELEMQNRELRDSRRHLEESLSMYADLYDYAPVGYMTFDHAGCIRKINLTAASMIVDKREHAVDIPFMSFLEKAETKRFHDFLRDCSRSGHKTSMEFKLTPRRKPPVLVHMTAMPYTEGQHTFYRTCIIDVTGMKAVEEKNETLKRELLLSQRMDLAGRLSGALLHDFNNVVTVISSYAELASMPAAAGENTPQYLSGINEASEKALALLRQLHLLNGSRVEKPETFSINDSIQDAATLVSRISGIGGFSTVLDAGVPDVECVRGSFEQLLLNVLLLAAQHRLAGSEVEVSTRKTDMEGRTCASLKVILASDGRNDFEKSLHEALLSYPAQPRLPNSSLKAIRSITDSLGAAIELRGGNKIDITFHIPTASHSKPADGAPAQPQTGANQRIMLVEDEILLRKSMALVLSKNGYTVFQASCALEADELFDKEGGKFDLLLTDLILKSENGLELARKLSDKNPAMRVLFTSGCLDLDAEWPDFHAERNHFIQKPFEIQELLKSIASCLDENSARGCSQP